MQKDKGKFVPFLSNLRIEVDAALSPELSLPITFTRQHVVDFNFDPRKVLGLLQAITQPAFLVAMEAEPAGSPVIQLVAELDYLLGVILGEEAGAGG